MYFVSNLPSEFLKNVAPAPPSALAIHPVAYSRFNFTFITNSFLTVFSRGEPFTLSGTRSYDWIFFTMYEGIFSKSNSLSLSKKFLPFKSKASTCRPFTLMTPPFSNSTPGNFLMRASSIDPSAILKASASYTNVSPSM